LKITKNATGNDGAFTFSMVNSSGTFGAVIDTNISNMTETFTIGAGNHTVTEIEIPGWRLENSNCEINDIPQNTTENFQVVGGDFVECVFDNVVVQNYQVSVNATLGMTDTVDTKISKKTLTETLQQKWFTNMQTHGHLVIWICSTNYCMMM